MDNTELHYLSYDPDTLWTTMTTAWIAAGGSVLYAGDEKEMLLRGVQEILFMAFAGMDAALRMATLRYAAGDYLDMIGERRGCARLEAKAAEAEVYLTLSASDSAGVIPAGALLTADGGVTWALKNDLSYTGMVMNVTVGIVCTETGSAGNSLAEDTYLQFVEGYPNVYQAQVVSAGHGGRAREDDESYRERIRLLGLASVTTGPKEQYEAAARTASSFVADASAVRTGDGEVTVYIIASESLADTIAAVEEALNSDTARPLTDSVIVAEAEEKQYILNAVCQTPEGSNLSSAISEAVTEYREWQDGHIGRPFNPEMLTSLLYRAGCTRVQYGTGSEFDGGEAVYTPVDENVAIAGVVNVSA